VQEYLVWSVLDRELYWYRLQDERYVAQHPDADGIIESSIFPGLRLNVAALLNGDLAQVLADLQEGLNSAGHAAFV
jgi:Uma2 family endonuclease